MPNTLSLLRDETSFNWFHRNLKRLFPSYEAKDYTEWPKDKNDDYDYEFVFDYEIRKVILDAFESLGMQKDWDIACDILTCICEDGDDAYDQIYFNPNTTLPQIVEKIFEVIEYNRNLFNLSMKKIQDVKTKFLSDLNK